MSVITFTFLQLLLYDSLAPKKSSTKVHVLSTIVGNFIVAVVTDPELQIRRITGIIQR